MRKLKQHTSILVARRIIPAVLVVFGQMGPFLVVFRQVLGFIVEVGESSATFRNFLTIFSMCQLCLGKEWCQLQS